MRVCLQPQSYNKSGTMMVLMEEEEDCMPGAVLEVDQDGLYVEGEFNVHLISLLIDTGVTQSDQWKFQNYPSQEKNSKLLAFQISK